MENFDEKVCACALNRIFGYIPNVGYRLYDYAGSARAVFRMDREEIAGLFRGHPGYAARLGEADLEATRRELEDLAGRGHRFVGLGEEGYPALLKECPDPPLGLYVSSGSDLKEVFDGRPQVAVVGTRDLTPYGREWCIRIVRALAAAERPPVVVSGLAFGTDVTAHLSALGEGLPTIAVLPTGIDRIYPFRHTGVAERIRAAPGSALVTDYPPGTTPAAHNFIRRNRIIAGLSRAVLLIESRIRGGGMITMRFAADYFRDAYALPGRVDDPCSQGCNLLIRNSLATAITDVEDLVGRLGLGARAAPGDPGERAERILTGRFGPERARPLLRILSAIRQTRGITPDALCAALDMDYRTVAEGTALLETEGFIATDLLQRCSINPKNV